MTRALAADDHGVTLVELIVAIVVSGLFAGLLTLMFVNGWTLQERSVARDSATGQANLVKTTMSDALRNAVLVRVSSSGTRVDAVVALPTASYTGTWAWQCRAWVFTDDSIRYSAGDTIRDTDTSDWAVLAGKSAQRPDDSVTGTIPGATPAQAFDLVGSKGVQIGVDITVGGAQSETVSVSDGMTAQATGPAAVLAGAPECWH